METEKPFSSVGAPSKFDLSKAKIYLKGLDKLIDGVTDSYKLSRLKKERDKIIEQIAYYEVY